MIDNMTNTENLNNASTNKIELPFNKKIIVKVKDIDCTTGEEMICYHCVTVIRYWVANDSKTYGYEAYRDGIDRVFYISFNDLIDYRIVEEF